MDFFIYEPAKAHDYDLCIQYTVSKVKFFLPFKPLWAYCPLSHDPVYKKKRPAAGRVFSLPYTGFKVFNIEEEDLR